MNEYQNQKFETLLAAMPQIAEAVNAFNTRHNQHLAMQALMTAAGVATFGVETEVPSAREERQEPIPEVDVDVERSAEGDVAGEVSGAEAVKTKVLTKPLRKRRSPKRWEPVRDIDFFPEGNVHLADLVAQKQPTNADQRNLVAVWWLEQVAGMSEIGVPQVLAVYKECRWPEPTRPDNALQVTASRNAWIDTADMTAVRTTPSGRNFLTWKMPVVKAEAK